MAACVALLCAACQTPPAPAAPVTIALQVPPDISQAARVDVIGLSPSEISGLRGASLEQTAWQAIFRVTTESESAPSNLPPVQGHYVVRGDVVSFTPRFPFMAGRPYHVVFDPAKMPRPREAPAIVTTVSLPRLATTPTTVAGVYPSAEVLPENLLRMYVEFSGPMGSSGAQQFVRLIDRSGPAEEVVEGAFLPVEADFWSPDHRRYTLFFDPGRVKQDILPNRQSGRPLKAGRRYALEIAAAWTDANRQPLASSFRREFRAGPAVDSAITLREWTLTAPGTGTTDPILVSFPRPLDHAVVTRALSIETADRQPLRGSSRVEAGDSRWSFVPDAPWRSGEHHLVALSFLEDPQGNQIDRPFEEAVDAPTPAHAPDAFRISFTTQPARPSP